MSDEQKPAAATPAADPAPQHREGAPAGGTGHSSPTGGAPSSPSGPGGGGHGPGSGGRGPGGGGHGPGGGHSGPRREGGPRRDGPGGGPGGPGGPGGRPRGKRQYFRKKKVCKFCVEKMDLIDYKRADILSQFVQERGKILPRRMTGVCSRHQRWLGEAIKRARNIALLPFAGSALGTQAPKAIVEPPKAQ
jgi:small subunit ribosomal protein S18